MLTGTAWLVRVLSLIFGVTAGAAIVAAIITILNRRSHDEGMTIHMHCLTRQYVDLANEIYKLEKRVKKLEEENHELVAGQGRPETRPGD